LSAGIKKAMLAGMGAVLNPIESGKTADGGGPSLRGAGRRIVSPSLRRGGVVRPFACRIPPAGECFHKSSAGFGLLTRKNHSSIHTTNITMRIIGPTKGNVQHSECRLPDCHGTGFPPVA